MMKKIKLLLVITLFTCGTILAQTGISFAESEKYDPDRYKDTNGSPYFFSDFTDGWIKGTDGLEYDRVKMNYNGHTETFEVLQGDRFINLQESPYKSISLLKPETQDTITFIRGVHTDFRGKYIQLLYESEKSTLVNQFSINLAESTVNTVGRTDVLKRFKPQNTYYVKLAKEPKLIQVKGNKKSWTKAFGNKKTIEAFLGKNKLNLSEEADMVLLLQYIETL